jgi:ABC-type glutathione transport system ATPase component
LTAQCMNSSPLLAVDLSADYGDRRDVLRRVTFDIQAGEILGLAGQSGSGKSTIALSIMGLLRYKGGAVRGSVRLRGENLLDASESRMRSIRGREMALVLQSPMSSLNPALRIGAQLSEAFQAHCDGARAERLAAIAAAMESVSLEASEAFLRRYPRELSVGQAQRVLIAMAVLHRPSLLIADEATSALDPITQAEILRLFARLSRELSMAVLYISHDLLSIAALCARMAILHQGEIVECSPVARIFETPAHPYTRSLVAAIPSVPCSASIQAIA